MLRLIRDASSDLTAVDPVQNQLKELHAAVNGTRSSHISWNLEQQGAYSHLVSHPDEGNRCVHAAPSLAALPVQVTKFLLAVTGIY